MTADTNIITTFQSFKNIGNVCANKFASTGLKPEAFLQMSPEDVVLYLIEHGEANWALTATRMLMRAIWGAQNNRRFDDVPEDILKRFDAFLDSL